MIETGTIVELSNHKKYIMTESTVEDGKIYYLALEVDYNTETPTDNSMFFEQYNNEFLLPIKNEDDIDFLKTIFVNKFLTEVLNEG